MRKLRLLSMFLLLASLGAWAQSRTIAEGTEIKVRTDTAIPAHPLAGAGYTASVSENVPDTSGGIAIPRGSRATLVAEATDNGKDTALDLHSVTVGGKTYELVSAGGKGTATAGLGANKRTAKYVGGGAVIGTVLGALFGGGKGAAIGAITGGAAGAGAEVLTGKKKGLPAETPLTYKLAQPLPCVPWPADSGKPVSAAVTVPSNSAAGRQVCGKELQSHEASEAIVLGLIDHTHPAAAQFLDDAVVRYGLADHASNPCAVGSAC